MLADSGMGAVAQSTLVEPVLWLGRLCGIAIGVGAGFLTLQVRSPLVFLRIQSDPFRSLPIPSDPFRSPIPADPFRSLPIPFRSPSDPLPIPFRSPSDPFRSLPIHRASTTCRTT